MGKLINANEEEFNKILENERGTIILDFYGTWCGPCKTLGIVLDDLVLEVDDLIVVKIDVDQNKNMISEYGVKGIPAVFLFKDGINVNKFVGFKKKEDIISFIETGV